MKRCRAPNPHYCRGSGPGAPRSIDRPSGMVRHFWHAMFPALSSECVENCVTNRARLCTELYAVLERSCELAPCVSQQQTRHWWSSLQMMPMILRPTSCRGSAVGVDGGVTRRAPVPRRCRWHGRTVARWTGKNANAWAAPLWSAIHRRPQREVLKLGHNDTPCLAAVIAHHFALSFRDALSLHYIGLLRSKSSLRILLSVAVADELISSHIAHCCSFRWLYIVFAYCVHTIRDLAKMCV